MKKIITAVLLFISFASFGQNGVDSTTINTSTPMAAKQYQFKYLKVDSGLSVRKRFFAKDSAFFSGKTYALTLPASGDSSNQVPSTKWVKQELASVGIGDTAGRWVYAIAKNATADSIVYYRGGVRYAIKDSSARDTVVSGRGLTGTPITATKVQIDNDSGYYAGIVRDDTLVLYRYNGDSTELTLPSGGGGSTPGLSAITAVDSTTDTGIKIAQAAAVTKGTMTFFGNSVTAGYGLPNQSLRWTQLVSDFLGYTENNAGLSSSTLMKRVTVDPFGATNMVDRIPLIPYFTAGSKLVFSYGFNDVIWNGANYTTANFVADYTTILDSCVARGWSGADIVLCGTFYVSPTSYISRGGNPAADATRQRQFDSCINVLATTYTAKYYDAYEFMENNGARTLSQSDSIHPNTQGHKVFALGFIETYNEPVRIGGQKLAVNGQADMTALKFSTIATTHSKKATEVVLDSAGNLAASTLRHVYYNNYGNIEIGDNADSIPYRLAVDGSAMLNDGLNIYNKYASSYNKWLKLYSDYTTGVSNIDAYTPAGAKAVLNLNTASKGNVKLAYADPSYNAGHIFDSIYANLGSTVIHSAPPAMKTGLNLSYFTGTASIISSNTNPTTYTTPLSLQGFGGNTVIGGYTGSDSILRVIGGIHGTGGVRFSGLPSNQTYSKSLAVTSNGTLFLKDTLAVSGVYAPLAGATFTGAVNGTSFTGSGAGNFFNIISTGYIRAAATSFIAFNTRSVLYSSADGKIEAKNWGNTEFSSVESLYHRFGAGSPEGVVTAPVGCIYSRTDGGAGTSLYVKESGTGNTGWVAK